MCVCLSGGVEGVYKGRGVEASVKSIRQNTQELGGGGLSRRRSEANYFSRGPKTCRCGCLSRPSTAKANTVRSSDEKCFLQGPAM